MTLNYSQLIHLSVETQSGQYLGKIISFEIDPLSQSIVYYHVKSGLIKGLDKKELIIHQNQVISISKEKMIVEDNVSKEPVEELGKTRLVTSINQ